MTLTDAELSALKRELYADLARDLYLILQRMGLSGTRAAEASNLLQQRGRQKGLRAQPVGQYYTEHRHLELISQTSDPCAMTRDDDDVTCPACGRPTLASTHTPDQTGGDSWRCVNCGHTPDPQGLETSSAHAMGRLMMANPRTEPIAKGVKSDIDLPIEKYIPSKDITTKSIKVSVSYAMSTNYQRTLRSYLEDLPRFQVDKVIRSIVVGITNRTTVREVSDTIGTIIEDPQRAELIATTEIARIMNRGVLEQLRDSGRETAVWIAVPEDGRVCPTCQSRHNKRYDVSWLLKNLPAHPRCRCVSG